MAIEKQTHDYKSIRKIRTGDKGFAELAKSCVAFANAQGGTLYIGLEDEDACPLPDQTVKQEELNDTLSRLRSLTFNTSIAGSEIIEHKDGGQYFEVYVAPSMMSIATTSDGKIYIRIGDKCEPVRNEDLQRLAIEKGGYQWELIDTSYAIEEISEEAICAFCQDIRSSDRVSNHVRQLSDIEILEYYNMLHNGVLTNIGVLWLGNASQRSRLSYPLTVQYIVYDEHERKIRKEEWHDNRLNPKELLLDIESKALELRYSYEFPDGLFRKHIMHYNPKVVRELLINAFAHKSYTLSRDIIIAVYPDRLEISNPGGLPLGINKENILHQKHRRNPYMIAIMSDLKLMEGEGSGYDLIYEINASESKQAPVIESSFSEVCVTQYCAILKPEILPLIDYVSKYFPLNQKGFTAFCLIASNSKMRSTELASVLQLTEEDRLRNYTQPLLSKNLIVPHGTRKGTYYTINIQLIINSRANIVTTLKTLEPHVLKTLILEDLKQHPNSLISEIEGRLPGVDRKDLQKLMYSMVDKEIISEGPKAVRRYKLKQ